MTVKTIYIARHGYRSNWLPTGPYPPPPTGVDSDVPLAKHGIDQAKELAHYIVSLDNQPELIFSSPFYRCIQTSEPIADILELPIQIERGLGEWYRPDRPIIPVAAPIETLEHFFPGKVNPKWESISVVSDKGETEINLFKRCADLWPKFIGKIENEYPNVETILIVTHAATKAALGMSLMGYSNWKEPLDEDGSIIRSGSCSLDKYEVHLTGSIEAGEEYINVPFTKRNWRMTMNGNAEFLSLGEEMNWDYRNAFEAGSDADIKLRKEAAAKGAKDVVANTSPGDEKEFESVYVSVDIPSADYRGKSEIDRTACLQHSGLETEAPLFKIKDKIYEGSWKKLVGTELAFFNEASVNKKSDKGAKESNNISSNHDEQGNMNSSQQAASHESDEQEDANEDKAKHSEKIYKITDRVVLSGLRRL